jgi:hypothetical protein
MGMSTDAILFWGIELGDEDEVPWGEQDLEDWLIDKLGCGDREKKKRVLKVYGFDFGIHCSYSCPVWYLYAKEFIAWRGSPVVITEKDLQEKPVKRGNLIALCKKLDIPYQKPEWILCSYADL